MTAKPERPRGQSAPAADIGDITISYHPGDRANLRLSFDPLADHFRLDHHKGADRNRLEAFLAANRSWMQKTLQTYGPRRPLLPGAVIPVGDDRLVIRLDPAAPAKPRRAGNILTVCGPDELVAARVKSWLKAECRARMTAYAEAHALTIGARIIQLRVKEVKSRWGSCRRTAPLAGNLNFSWRLIFAPTQVQNYLAAHEVSHLKHHGHGRAFWALCHRLCPQTAEAERWLDRHGPGLMRYG